MFDTRCCRCAAAIHCQYSLRSPIYCSSGFQTSRRCRFRVRATTCRAGIPSPSPAVSSSSSPRMIWICRMKPSTGGSSVPGGVWIASMVEVLSPRETPSAVAKMTKDIVVFCRALGLTGHAGQKGHHKEADRKENATMTTQTATKSEQAHQNAEKKIQKVREL